MTVTTSRIRIAMSARNKTNEVGIKAGRGVKFLSFMGHFDILSIIKKRMKN